MTEQSEYSEHLHIYDDDGKLCATVIIADMKVAQTVLNAPIAEEGRSPWLWVRLANGDLILGCFPRGETYLNTEDDPNRP